MSLAAADIYLVILGFYVLGSELVSPPQRGRASTLVFNLTWSGLLVLLVLLSLKPVFTDVVLLGGYVLSSKGILFKFIFTLCTFFSVLVSRSYFVRQGNRRGRLRMESEFYGLLIFCLFGMFTVVSANNLITLLIGIELATIPLYALVAMYKDVDATEAAMKYIIMGSLSTAISLFGYSFVYGACGSVGFAEIKAFADANPQDMLLWVGVLFILISTGFKLAIAPFHMWAPDVYEGAPTPVTAFLSVGSKSAAVAFVMVLFFGPLNALLTQLHHFFIVVSILSMVVGNLGALRQRNLRRFLAYSSISQAGYIMLGFLGSENFSQTALIYYLLVYAVTNLCFFFIIAVIGQKRKEEFASLRGLSKQSPALAGLLMLVMFSLAGIPPLAGFTGKFMLFAAAAENGHYALVAFAALNSTVSLYYYLLVIKEAYILKPKEEVIDSLEITFAQRISMLVLGLGILLLGLLPVVTNKISQIIQI